jgi:hypothetical protein
MPRRPASRASQHSSSADGGLRTPTCDPTQRYPSASSDPVINPSPTCVLETTGNYSPFLSVESWGCAAPSNSDAGLSACQPLLGVFAEWHHPAGALYGDPTLVGVLFR